VRRKLRSRSGEQLNVPDDLDASLAGALRDRMAIEREAGGYDEAIELGEVGFVEVCYFGTPAKAGVQGSGNRCFAAWAPAFAGEQPVIPHRHLRTAG
jgi:hypothetical protein